MGISTEVYPDLNKLPKQLKYADAKTIPYVVLIGEEEFQKNEYSMKNMEAKTQVKFNREDLIQYLQSELKVNTSG
jgi:histidyl-tRNA synthetase